MKKTLLSLAAIVVVAYPVLAKMPKIDVNGELRVRGERINNLDGTNTTAQGAYDDLDDHVKHRVRVQLDAVLSDGVGAHINLQKPDDRREWGRLDQTSVGSLTDNVSLRHAYITIDNIAGLVDLSLGRQEIGKKDRELVFWADAIDAKVAKAGLKNLSLMGFCAKELEQSHITRGSDTDTDIQGITGSIKLDVLGGIDLTGYGIRRIVSTSTSANDQKNNILGVKVSGEMEIASTLSYSVEYARQTGTMSDWSGEKEASAYRGVLGYKTDVEGLGNLAIEGSYLKMSGTKDMKGEYPNGTKTFTGINPDLDYYAKLVDQASAVNSLQSGLLKGGNGLKAINVNCSVKPEAIENLSLGISYTSFASAEKVKEKTGMGSELDLTAGYTYSKDTTIGLTYARFAPGDVQKAQGKNDSATMLRFELLTKF